MRRALAHILQKSTAVDSTPQRPFRRDSFFPLSLSTTDVLLNNNFRRGDPLYPALSFPNCYLFKGESPVLFNPQGRTLVPSSITASSNHLFMKMDSFS